MACISRFGKVTEDPVERNSKGMREKLAALAPQEPCGLVFDETFDTATFFPKGENGHGEPLILFDETPPSLKTQEVTGISALAIVTGMLETGAWRRVEVSELSEARAKKKALREARAKAEINPEFITFREAWDQFFVLRKINKHIGRGVISFVKQWNSRCAPEDRIEAYPPELNKSGLVHKQQLRKAIARCLEENT